MAEPTGYTGRFAPSPTGPLHFGSLLAAVASYLEARSHAGRWLLRIENIDPPREQAGAADAIVRTLAAYGFDWDGPTDWQQDAVDAHRDALDRLLSRGLAYYCTCSRNDLSDVETGPLGMIYPGTCRGRSRPPDGDAAVRVVTDESVIEFDDRLQGHQSQCLAAESGDFVVWRRDGLVAYHLAVVVDDHRQGVTDIVRGVDLLDSTPRQVWLQQMLGFPTPGYAHIPVAVWKDGNKLSKATHAPALPESAPGPALARALAVLGQSPPDELAQAALPELWDWAIANWDMGGLRGQTSVTGA